MKKTTYWKDVWRTFVASKGRMLSIALLMALGSFALIGLKVTSPNMKKTGEHFFKTHQTADLSLISTYSINQTDQDLLNSIKKKNVDIEYGYFKDAVIKGTNTAFRIFSKPNKISTYDLIEGKLPTKDGEIALSSTYKEEYSVGDKINFSEPVDSSGQKQLKEQHIPLLVLLIPLNFSLGTALVMPVLVRGNWMLCHLFQRRTSPLMIT